MATPLEGQKNPLLERQQNALLTTYLFTLSRRGLLKILLGLFTLSILIVLDYQTVFVFSSRPASSRRQARSHNFKFNQYFFN